ncbi:MAG: hypothetical protein ABFC89_11560 [Methanospirillum sp.]
MREFYLCRAPRTNTDAEVPVGSGIKRKVDPLAPRPYPRCHTIGGPGSRFCSICGQALAAEIADAKRTLWSDPDMLIELAAEVRERNAREAGAASVAAAPTAMLLAPAA